MQKNIFKIIAYVLSGVIVFSSITPNITYASTLTDKEIVVEETESLMQEEPAISEESVLNSASELITEEMPDGSNYFEESEIALGASTNKTIGLSDLGLSIHSQQDIRNFIAAHPVDLYETVKYDVIPHTPAPYVVGKISDQTANSALDTYNTIRYIAGLNSDVTIDSELQNRAQTGALLLAACDMLTHYPPKMDDMDQDMYDYGCKGVPCISTAYELQLNQDILGWISDNENVHKDNLGHRNYLLHTDITKMGIGIAGDYYSSIVVDTDNIPNSIDLPSAVIWPAHNTPMEYSQRGEIWNFHTKDSNFSINDNTSVNVTRTRDGKTWNFNDTHSDGYYYKTQIYIDFLPEELDEKENDVFNVTIKNLLDNRDNNYIDVNYTVNFFSATRNPGEYLVEFINNGNEETYQSVVPNGKIIKPADPVDTVNNTVFLGWYKDSDYTIPWNFDTDVVTSDMTLYAKREYPSAHRCRIYTWPSGGNYTDYQIPYGETVAKPQDPDVREGYAFVNWYTFKEGEKTLKIKNGLIQTNNMEVYDFSRPITKNISIYAVWKYASSEPEPGPGPEPTPTPTPEPDPTSTPTPTPTPTPEPDPVPKPDPIDERITIVTGQKINVKNILTSEEPIAKYRVELTGYDVSGTAYATVSNKGILSSKRAGQVTVIPQKKVGKTYEDIEDITLTVNILEKPTLKFTKAMSYIGQTVNAKDFFPGTFDANAAEIQKWESSKPAIASIDRETGEITAKSTGSTTITVYFSTKGINNAENTIKVTGKLEVKIPAFSKPTITMQTGQTLVVTMKNVTATTDVTYSTDDEDILSAELQINKGKSTGKAVLHAIKGGNITLTAIIDEKPYTCSVTIQYPTITKTALRVKATKSTTIGLKNTKYKKSDIVWISEDPSIAEVGTNGKIIGKQAGKSVVIYTETGGVRNECEVTVY